jgi:hypothetical protein
VKAYISQLGIREATGHNDGKQVETYLAVTKLGKGNPWCAAFLAWCFHEAGVVTINSAYAPNWFPSSKTIYTRGNRLNLKFTPTQADVFGLWFNNLHRIAHVGFIDQWSSGNGYVITVEGNTNEAGSREGDGVYRKRRLKRTIYKVANWIDKY